MTEAVIENPDLRCPVAAEKLIQTVNSLPVGYAFG
jgi:hypothetical protein